MILNYLLLLLTYLSTHLSTHLPIRLTSYLLINLITYLRIYLLMYILVHVLTYLSTYRPTYLHCTYLSKTEKPRVRSPAESYWTLKRHPAFKYTAEVFSHTSLAMNDCHYRGFNKTGRGKAYTRLHIRTCMYVYTYM